MTDSKRKEWFFSLFTHYCTYKARKGLDGLWIKGLDAIQKQLQHSSVILAPNHVAWWDTILLFPLSKALGGTAHALMDAKNLRALPFFAWGGALPLRRDTRAHARDDLIASAAVLDKPNSYLWLFPQGKQRPSHLRPLRLKSGIQHLARHSKKDVVPVSFQYIFRENAQPAAAVVFGDPIAHDHPSLLQELESKLILGLNECDTLHQQEHGFHICIPPKQTRSEKGWGTRMLSVFSRPQLGESDA